MTVIYWPRFDAIFIRQGNTYFHMSEDVIMSFLVSSVKDWSQLVQLGEL